MCCTSFGFAVVPDVKYSSSDSDAASGRPARTPRPLTPLACSDCQPSPAPPRALQVRAVEPREPIRVRSLGDHRLRAAARHAVTQIGRHHQCRRGNDRAGQLDRRQHQLPQVRHVAEHQQDAVAATQAERAQVVRQAIRALPQLLERLTHVAAAVADDAQRRARVVPGNDVEPIERPVEVLRPRPRERSRPRARSPPDGRSAYRASAGRDRCPSPLRTPAQLRCANHASMAGSRSRRTLMWSWMLATVVSAMRREPAARCALA